MTVVVGLILEREAGFLGRAEMAAKRAVCDFELFGERIDGRAMPRGFKGVKQLPLTNDFLVAGHGRILSWPSFFETTDFTPAVAIGRARGLRGRPMHALDAPGFDFFWRRLGRLVVVERARF